LDDYFKVHQDILLFIESVGTKKSSENVP